MRCFVAVLFDPPLRASLAAAARELCGPLPGFRLVAEKNLHMTLQFLGEIEINQIDIISEAISAASMDQASFEIEFAGSGAFPNARRARIAWIGVRQGAQLLVQLASHVACGLESLGFMPDKPFTPHVTVARSRGRATASLTRSLPAERAITRLQVSAVHLVESRLSAGGPQYGSLFLAPLSGPNRGSSLPSEI